MRRTRRDLERAEADVEAARERLVATMGEIQNRLNPKLVLREVWSDLRTRGDEAAGGAIDLVRTRPGATAGVVAALAVLVLRHPIGRSLAKVFFGDRETEAAGGKLNADTATPKPTRSRRPRPVSDKGD